MTCGSRNLVDQEGLDTSLFGRLGEGYVKQQFDPHERRWHMVNCLHGDFHRRRYMRTSLLVGRGLRLGGFVLAAVSARLMIRVDLAGLRLVLFAAGASILVRAEISAAAVHVIDHLHRQVKARQDQHQELHIEYSNEIQTTLIQPFFVSTNSRVSLHVSQGLGFTIGGQRRGPVEGAPPVVRGSVHLRHMLQSPAFSPHIMRSPLCSQKLRRSVCFPTVTNM